MNWLSIDASIRALKSEVTVTFVIVPGLRAGDLDELAGDQAARVVEDHVEASPSDGPLGARAEHERAEQAERRRAAR